MKILRYDDYPVAPWKNGQGVTRDITRLSLDGTGRAGVTGFIWRLSLADVGQSGAFSEFDGYDRTITLLDGNGFTLNFEDGKTKTLDVRYAPYDFDGGAPLFCDLIDGPCRDFNLIVKRGSASARWRVHDLATPLVLEPQTNTTHLIFCLYGCVNISAADGGRHTLNAWDNAEPGTGETVTLTADTDTPSRLFHASITVASSL